jgi:hypothetical protein
MKIYLTCRQWIYLFKLKCLIFRNLSLDILLFPRTSKRVPNLSNFNNSHVWQNTKLEIYCSHVIRFPYKRILPLVWRLPKGKPVARQLWWVDTWYWIWTPYDQSISLAGKSSSKEQYNLACASIYLKNLFHNLSIMPSKLLQNVNIKFVIFYRWT